MNPEDDGFRTPAQKKVLESQGGSTDGFDILQELTPVHQLPANMKSTQGNQNLSQVLSQRFENFQANKENVSQLKSQNFMGDEALFSQFQS